MKNWFIIKLHSYIGKIFTSVAKFGFEKLGVQISSHFGKSKWRYFLVIGRYVTLLWILNVTNHWAQGWWNKKINMFTYWPLVVSSKYKSYSHNQLFGKHQLGNKRFNTRWRWPWGWNVVDCGWLQCIKLQIHYILNFFKTASYW